MDNKLVIKVAGKSNVGKVSGSIVKGVESHKTVEIHAIGASANNQCVKALASSRGILATKGIDAYFKVGFSETVIEGMEKTMMIYTIVTK